MFIVQLKFADKSRAGEFMDAHNQWIQQGFDDGVFLLVGGLQPALGGAVVAHNISREALQERVARDPFVEHGVVEADVLEISPARSDERLAFLCA